MGGGDPSDHVRVCVIAVKRALEALTFSATPTFARPLIENVFLCQNRIEPKGLLVKPCEMQNLAWVQELVQSPNDNAVAPEDLQAREEFSPRDFVAQVDRAPRDFISASPTSHPVPVDRW